MPALDVNHTFVFKINGTDRWQYVIAQSLRMTDAEGGEVDTLRFEVEDATDTLEIEAWQEVKVHTADATEWSGYGEQTFGTGNYGGFSFGGFVVEAKPRLSANETGRIWEVICESYVTILPRTPKIRKTYTNTTPGVIVADLFSLAGLTEFDAALHVQSGTEIGIFATDGEDLPAILDRLQVICTDVEAVQWGWRIDADKFLHFGPISNDPAPYGIAALDAADYSTTFPPLGDPSKDIDARDIRNRITVRGGSKASDETTQNFTGDGATLVFQVDYRPILDVVSITLDGVIQSFGKDWFDTYGGGWNVLIDYSAGTFRYQAGAAPGAGLVLSVVYRYSEAITTAVQDDASYAAYGRWFDYEIRDPAITSDAAATLVANAMLDEYAFGKVTGSITTGRLGLRAGQEIGIEFPVLGLTGTYIIRGASSEFDPGNTGMLTTIKYGGRNDSLTAALGGTIGGGASGGGASGRSPAYEQPITPAAEGEVGILRIRDRILLVDPATGSEKARIGDLSGLSGASGYGIWTSNGFFTGSVTATTGAIGGWDIGATTLSSGTTHVILDSTNKAISINSATYGQSGIQLQYNAGTPRAYIGNGSTKYFQYDGTDISWKGVNTELTAAGAFTATSATITGTINASAGDFTGSVYVGVGAPRIHIDGANKLIESTNYASGTSGFRMEGITGDAEFNNIRARGSIIATALQYGHVMATNGSLWVTPTAGKTVAAVTSVDSAGTFNIDIEDPDGMTHVAAGTLWAAGDVVRIKEPLVGDLWATISSLSDQTTFWRLVVVKDSPGAGTNYTFSIGASVLGYGASGEGNIQLTSDASDSPYINIATHAGAPWSTQTTRLRLGNLDGLAGMSGYGVYADLADGGEIRAGTGTVGADFDGVRLDATNGLRIVNTDVVKAYVDKDKIQWMDSATSYVRMSSTGAALLEVLDQDGSYSNGVYISVTDASYALLAENTEASATTGTAYGIAGLAESSDSANGAIGIFGQATHGAGDAGAATPTGVSGVVFNLIANDYGIGVSGAATGPSAAGTALGGKFVATGAHANNVIYGIYARTTGTADTKYPVYATGGQSFFDNSIKIDQSSTTAAIPALYLDQADVDQPFVYFNTSGDQDMVLEKLSVTGTPTRNWDESEDAFAYSHHLRATTSIYKRYYHINLSSANPGGSGATWVAPSATTIGGWRLDDAGDSLTFAVDVHADWDGASDLTVEVHFAKNTVGGSVGDTVDLQLQCFYIGDGEATPKSQTPAESVTAVGADARYTTYEAVFTIDWDAASNVVQAGDLFGFILNLETDTSECDDVIILQGGASFHYHTTHLGVETGDA